MLFDLSRRSIAAAMFDQFDLVAVGMERPIFTVFLWLSVHHWYSPKGYAANNAACLISKNASDSARSAAASGAAGRGRAQCLR
jgi:hypothetical protein